jgi:hypothetical protein
MKKSRLKETSKHSDGLPLSQHFSNEHTALKKRSSAGGFTETMTRPRFMGILIGDCDKTSPRVPTAIVTRVLPPVRRLVGPTNPIVMAAVSPLLSVVTAFLPAEMGWYQ